MILTAASKLYGAAAIARRRWYAARPGRVRRLSRPVVSIGNLRVGGTGKTPAVAHVARLLIARGERPSILSRGYRRPAPGRGVTVVSDPSQVLASFASAGDEPLMLARTLPGVPVLVGADRHESGCIAEERFGATVHLLDDGFQHLRLARDANLLLIGDEDLSDRVLPAGWLREPLSAAAAADAIVVNTERLETVTDIERRFGIPVFRLRRSLGDAAHSGRVLAVAGIARPEGFFRDLTDSGWKVAGTMSFPDHHVYTPADVERISTAARQAAVNTIVTTEKDAVRFERHTFPDATLRAVPLAIAIEPESGFAEWLFARLKQVRSPAPDRGGRAAAVSGRSAGR